jgi:hypothetical protein
MRLTIIPTDGAIYFDGVTYINLDLSACGIPNNIHAFQWYDTYGEIEYKRTIIDGQATHPANEIVTELPDWGSAAITTWENAKADEEARLLAQSLLPINRVDQ